MAIREKSVRDATLLAIEEINGQGGGAFDQGWKIPFLVASDYVFPRAANEIIKAQVAALRGRVTGEEYILLGSSDVNPAVEQIKAARPDVVFNTINGDTNVAFFTPPSRTMKTPSS